MPLIVSLLRPLLQAFQRGDATAPVRGGTREVTLVPPNHVQRQAPGRSSPCKERKVQRRMLRVSIEPLPALPTAQTRLDPGVMINVRWAASEKGARYEVRESRSFEEAGGEVQHLLRSVEDASEGWFELMHAYAVTRVDT